MEALYTYTTNNKTRGLSCVFDSRKYYFYFPLLRTYFFTAEEAENELFESFSALSKLDHRL